MNILHISDFHYCEDNYISERVVRSIVKAIKNMPDQIDCVLFTGDLVYFGNKSGDFNRAKSALFDPLADSLGIDSKNIIICPGNHDINRDKVYPTAENSFKTIYNSNQAINKLYHCCPLKIQDSSLKIL